MSARRHIAAWLPLGFLRSGIIKTTKGETSGVQTHFLRDLLLGEDSVRLQGVVLNIGPNREPVLVFASLARAAAPATRDEALQEQWPGGPLMPKNRFCC